MVVGAVPMAWHSPSREHGGGKGGHVDRKITPHGGVIQNPGVGLTATGGGCKQGGWRRGEGRRRSRRRRRRRKVYSGGVDRRSDDATSVDVEIAVHGENALERDDE